MSILRAELFSSVWKPVLTADLLLHFIYGAPLAGLPNGVFVGPQMCADKLGESTPFLSVDTCPSLPHFSQLPLLHCLNVDFHSGSRVRGPALMQQVVFSRRPTVSSAQKEGKQLWESQPMSPGPTSKERTQSQNPKRNCIEKRFPGTLFPLSIISLWSDSPLLSVSVTPS